MSGGADGPRPHTARAHAPRGDKALVRRAHALATQKGLALSLADVEQLGRELGISPR